MLEGLQRYGLPIWVCLVMGYFRSEYKLESIYNLEIISLFLLLINMHHNLFEQVSLREIKRKESYYLMD